MKLDKKQFTQYKSIITPETLKLIMAKKGIHIDDQEAEMFLKLLDEATMNEKNEEALEDEELENVAGGSICDPGHLYPEDFKGKRCRLGNRYGTVIDTNVYADTSICGLWHYEHTVQFDDGEIMSGLEDKKGDFHLV